MARRLDYFFISNQLQETVKKTDILAAFTSSDHYPLIFTLSMNQDEPRRKVLWKFNKSLALNSDFIDKMKAHIASTQTNLDKQNIRDDQARWEYLKYEIRKFSIKFSKLFSKNTKTQCTANYLDNSEYISCKSKLDQFYEEKANGIRIRSKCNWHKYGEKSTKFFLNLEKIRAHQNKIRNILKNGKKITDQKEVHNELFDFYDNLFKSDKRSSKYDIAKYEIRRIISNNRY